MRREGRIRWACGWAGLSHFERWDSGYLGGNRMYRQHRWVSLISRGSGVLLLGC
jgi:hypothetical protein